MKTRILKATCAVTVAALLLGASARMAQAQFPYVPSLPFSHNDTASKVVTAVVIAATMSMFKIPEAGLLLILAVDHFLDMGRSATNVVGNAVAASVVARWEGDLGPPLSPDIEPAAPARRKPRKAA